MRILSTLVYLIVFLIDLPRRFASLLRSGGTYWHVKGNRRRERRFF